VKLLGFVYLAAFWSLAVQARGLLGEGGILPVRLTMDGARAYVSAFISVLIASVCCRRCSGGVPATSF
jgi:hypothetical protein